MASLYELKGEYRDLFAELAEAETDEQAAEFSRPRKYVFETEWRTADAVQIWSVGPDGIDDGGLRSTDDIRFVIPIQGEP